MIEPHGFAFPSLLVLAIVALGQQRSTAPAPQPVTPVAPAQQFCKCHRRLVGPSYMVYGRLSLYSSAPTARIAVVGTKRVLGLRGVPEWLGEELEDPRNVIVADFLVCPITQAKRGTIQLVCIDAANNMVVTQKP